VGSVDIVEFLGNTEEVQPGKKQTRRDSTPPRQ